MTKFDVVLWSIDGRPQILADSTDPGRLDWWLRMQHNSFPSNGARRVSAFVLEDCDDNPVRVFARAILHGEDRHRAWLLEAAERFLAGEAIAVPTDPEAATLIPPDPKAWEIHCAPLCNALVCTGTTVTGGPVPHSDFCPLSKVEVRNATPTLPDLQKHFDKIRSDDAHRPILEEARRLNDEEGTR